LTSFAEHLPELLKNKGNLIVEYVSDPILTPADNAAMAASYKWASAEAHEEKQGFAGTPDIVTLSNALHSTDDSCTLSSGGFLLLQTPLGNGIKMGGYIYLPLLSFLPLKGWVRSWWEIMKTVGRR
jgi:hypothetical protein